MTFSAILRSVSDVGLKPNGSPFVRFHDGDDFALVDFDVGRAHAVGTLTIGSAKPTCG